MQALDEMLHRALFHYKTSIKWKTMVDEMQSTYRCCGVNDYKDWFRYSWVDKNYVAKGGDMTGYMQCRIVMNNVIAIKLL